ncbi:hypothetical protein LCGC14_2350250 [marine sediment metagenome]|uniref:C2H2-type domain-containing protein n=1 Tax=marine sediment metagenome TaxID=412755 RepID=A0A0F9F4G7_9ZZZZ
MTTDVELAARVDSARPTSGYYRQPDGWITVSPITELEQIQYEKDGWERLRKYGRVEMTNAYAVNHPLEGLLMRGGAEELCLEQIIQSGFPLTPPLIPVCDRLLNQYHKRHDPECWEGAEPAYFPQLEGRDFRGYQCRFCATTPHPTQEARDQHEGVAHKDEKSGIRTGETLADSLATALKESGGVSVAPKAAPTPDSELQTRNPYACGICPESFTRAAELTKHIKKHQEPADEQEEEPVEELDTESATGTPA